MEIKIAKNNYIFIEDTVLTTPSFYLLLKDLIEKFEAEGKKATFYVDSNINERVENYKADMKFKEAYLLEGLLDILEQKSLLQRIETNSYLDYTALEEIFKKAKKETECIVLTQKDGVYTVFKELKNIGKSVAFYYIAENTFEEWQEQAQSTAPKDAFYLEDDEYVNRIDTTGIDYVYSPKYGYLKINVASQMNGGEGSVYRTYNNMMVKIFKKEYITYVNFKKLSEMIEMNLYNPFICWPRDLVYVGDNFVGYLMDEVKGAETLLSLRLQSFSEYTHPERFEICYNFLKHIKYLHDKGILIGDLKPDNILVKSPSEVYFIDCGCYQINDYACPVCHPEYTKRVFKKDELKKQLRTVEDEYYPINKMAFEIMIMKNHTYSPDNMDIENTDKSQFFYPLDVDGIDIQSEDMALWAKFLTPSMRKYFYYYFKQGKITDLSEWVKELQLFLEKIKKEMNSNGR